MLNLPEIRGQKGNDTNLKSKIERGEKIGIETNAQTNTHTHTTARSN